MARDQFVEILDGVRNAIDEIGWVDEGEKSYFATQRGRYWFMLKYLNEYVMAGQTLLDVGSHVLHFGMAVSTLGYQVWGADIERFVQNPLNRARQDRFGIAAVKVCELSRDTLPYDDNAFDVLNFSEALEHLNFRSFRVLSG